MNFLAIDLEMNQPSGTIIQVGVYIFNDKGEELQSSRIYINSGETLNPEIATLTGIKQEQLDNGISLVSAFEQIKWLRDNYKCAKQPVVWGAAYSNDSHLFWKQTYKFTEEQIMSRTWEGGNPLGHRIIDVKSLWQTYCIFNGGSIKG